MIKFDLQLFGGRGQKLGSRKNAPAPAPAMPQATPDLAQFTRSVESRSIEESLAAANPNRGTTGYDVNCQRCVFAYELQRRGYDVEAKQGGRVDPLSENWAYTYLVKNRDKQFKLIEGRTREQQRQAIEKQMKEWGDGARAAVSVMWTRRTGHAFIAENVKGEIRYIDPQTNSKNVRRYMNDFKPNYISNSGGTRHLKSLTNLLRLDNAEFTTDISKAVK